MLGGFPSLIHRIPVGCPSPNPTPGLSFSQSVVDFHPVPFLEAGQRMQEHPVRPESLSYKSARVVWTPEPVAGVQRKCGTAFPCEDRTHKPLS